MKTPRLSRSVLLAASAFCALSLSNIAFAQPEAPAALDAPAKANQPRNDNKNNKPKGEKKGRGKTLTPRVVTATEAAIGKPLTPELKEQLTTALQQRAAAVKAANDAYYAAFAQTTGLTPEQAKEIDKPARGGAKATDKPKPATPNADDQNMGVPANNDN